MSWIADAAHCDFETRSVVDLRQCGAYRYAEDPTTRPWCLSYRLDDGPVRRWVWGDPDPEDLLAHAADGGLILAHNAPFERVIWNTNLRLVHGFHWPKLEIKQMGCTMSRALAVHLPADLDSLSNVLQLAQTKDRDGHNLMMKMARPRKMHADGTITWWDEPDKIARLGAYCDMDVEVEYLVDQKLPPLSADERKLWELDQVINDRGVAIDLPSVRRIVGVLEVAQTRADQKMKMLTNGFVGKCTEATRIVDWLKGRGFPCKSIAKGEHAELLGVADVLGDDLARAVIELRAEAGRTGTAKFKRMLECVCASGRIHGSLMYHRASTGRFGGALIQPHNFARFEDANDNYLPHVLAAIDIMEQYCEAV